MDDRISLERESLTKILNRYNDSRNERNALKARCAGLEAAISKARKCLEASREAKHPTDVTVEMMALGDLTCALRDHGSILAAHDAEKDKRIAGLEAALLKVKEITDGPWLTNACIMAITNGFPPYEGDTVDSVLEAALRDPSAVLTTHDREIAAKALEDLADEVQRKTGTILNCPPAGLRARAEAIRRGEVTP